MNSIGWAWAGHEELDVEQYHAMRYRSRAESRSEIKLQHNNSEQEAKLSLGRIADRTASQAHSTFGVT